MSDDLAALAADAYLYGFPLIFDLLMAGGQAEMGMITPAPVNSFSHASRLAGPDDRFVSINNDARVIQFPTSVATIVGRWACDGPADLAAVQALQGNLTLEPYGAPGPSRGIPAPATVPGELAFFEQLRTWMQAFPPSAEDQEYQRRFAPLGLLDPASPYPDCPPELAHALTAGADAGKRRMEASLTAGGWAPAVNGWTLTFHSFDYNLDHLGPGTIDDPAWKMPDRHASYLARALAARGGLWGNHGYEAAYPMTYTDADGDQLDGRNRYVLRFDQDPPVDAFWSITMYDVPGFYLVANPISRYSIGDRTPGLRRDPDGSLTIMIQHDQPADTSNWCPPRPRRSGHSCAYTSHRRPSWTAPTGSRPSPRPWARPNAARGDDLVRVESGIATWVRGGAESRPSLRTAVRCSECRPGRRPRSPPPGPPTTAGSRPPGQIQTR